MKKNWIFAILFFVIWVGVGSYLAGRESPTFDERVHVEAGRRYFLGDFEFDPIEPPLLRMFVVLPTKLLGLGERLDFLNYRMVVIVISGILFSILIGLCGSFVGVLLLVEPNILTHGHLVTTDAISAILIVLSLVGFYRFPKNNWWMLWGSLAVSVKVSSVVYLGLGLLLMRVGWKNLLKFLIICACVIWATYLFQWQPVLSNKSVLGKEVWWGQIRVPLGGYLQALKENWQFGLRGQPIYFAGEVFTKGPFWKQIVVFLLKTPWPLLVLLFLAIKKNENGWLVILMTCYTILNAVVALHFGMRHQLVITFLMILMINNLGKIKWVGVMMCVILLTRIWPFTHTYSNIDNPIAIHSDADYDWGQGLIVLKEEMERRGIEKIQLAYFGNNAPEAYGINYERIRDENPMESKPLVKFNYLLPQAISVTCYQMCGYINEPLLKMKRVERIGGMLLFR